MHAECLKVFFLFECVCVYMFVHTYISKFKTVLTRSEMKLSSHWCIIWARLVVNIDIRSSSQKEIKGFLKSSKINKKTDFKFKRAG